MTLIDVLADTAAVLTCAGIVQAFGGYAAARAFRRRLDRAEPPNNAGSKNAGPNNAGPNNAGTAHFAPRPAMTILKPLCGDEPMLEAALASICAVEYPDFQVVFGVQDPHDTAIAVVERLRERFPERDIELVVNATLHGVNRKISNLMNMLPYAKHEFLVIGDSDVHVTGDYLDSIAAEFETPGTGLVTTLYAGLPADASLASALGASGISHGFLPGALMARRLGRQDTLGATMALRRSTLEDIGGFEALVPHIADDHILGALVLKQGLRVALAATLTSTTVPERTIAPLFRHELRWSRTVLSLVPFEFVVWSLQFPLFWAILTLVLSGGGDWAAVVFLSAWLARAACAIEIDRVLGLSRSGLAAPPPVLLLPLRDLLSIAVWLASYAGDQVEWRGRVMHTRASLPVDDIAYTGSDYTQDGYTPSGNAPAASAEYGI